MHADQRPSENTAMQVEAYFKALPGEQFPNLVAIAQFIAAGDADERFELLLNFFVDGLEHQMRRRPRRR